MSIKRTQKEQGGRSGGVITPVGVVRSRAPCKNFQRFKRKHAITAGPEVVVGKNTNTLFFYKPLGQIVALKADYDCKIFSPKSCLIVAQSLKINLVITLVIYVKRFLTGKLNFCGTKEEMEKRRIRREKNHFVAEGNGPPSKLFFKIKNPQYIGGFCFTKKQYIGETD